MAKTVVCCKSVRLFSAWDENYVLNVSHWVKNSVFSEDTIAEGEQFLWKSKLFRCKKWRNKKRKDSDALNCITYKAFFSQNQPYLILTVPKFYGKSGLSFILLSSIFFWKIAELQSNSYEVRWECFRPVCVGRSLKSERRDIEMNATIQAYERNKQYRQTLASCPKWICLGHWPK